MFNATKFYHPDGRSIVVTTPDAAAALGPEWFDSPKAAAAAHEPATAPKPTKTRKAAATAAQE